METGPAFRRVIESCVIRVSHTHRTADGLSRAAWGAMWAYLCASVCIFQLMTNAGEIQMSQNYQCPVKCPRGDNFQPMD